MCPHKWQQAIKFTLLIHSLIVWGLMKSFAFPQPGAESSTAAAAVSAHLTVHKPVCFTMNSTVISKRNWTNWRLSTGYFVSHLTHHICCSMLSNAVIVLHNKTMPRSQLRVMSRDHFWGIPGFSDHTISKVAHNNIKNWSLSDAIFLSTSSSLFCFQTNSVPLSSARDRLSFPSTVNNLFTERSQTSSPSTNTSMAGIQKEVIQGQVLPYLIEAPGDVTDPHQIAVHAQASHCTACVCSTSCWKDPHCMYVPISC